LLPSPMQLSFYFSWSTQLILAAFTNAAVFFTISGIKTTLN